MSHRGRLICEMESVRLKITEHMTSVGEEILCVLDKQQLSGDVCSVEINVRVFVLERLAAAADFMFNLFQRETETLETLLERQNKLLDAVSQPHVKLRRADFLHLPVCKDEVSPEVEERSPSPVQEKPESLHFREELRPRPEEANGSALTHTDENPETEPVASTSTYHLRTQADVEDCGTSPPTSDDQLLSSDCSEYVPEDGEDGDGWENAREDFDYNMQTPADVEDCGTSQPTSDDQLLPSDCSESEDGEEWEMTGEDGDEWEETGEGRSALKQSHDKTKILLGQKMSRQMSSKLSQHVKSSKLTQTTEHGTVKTRFTCTVCGKGFGQKGHLKSHVMTHSGEKPFTCKVCGKRFGHKGHLNTHMRTHTGEKPFTCTVCGKGYGQSVVLKTHMRTHTGEKPFSCTICDKGFAHRASLNNHTRTHTGEKPFTCTICGRGFTRRGHLNTHITTHTGGNTFTCTVCGKGVTNLKSHMMTHTGEKPFTCTVCGKSFKRTSQLNCHTRTHTEGKPFICTVCGKGCFNIKAHMRSHTGEKPFTCTICDKGFADRGVLKTHMRTHTGEKPFTCTICSRGFTHSGGLRNHIMTHTGEKPFICTVCGKGVHNIKTHMRTHTRDTVSPAIDRPHPGDE